MAERCNSLFPSVRNFSQQVLWSLRITNSIIGLLNIFGNSLLIYALKKTGQTTTISLQLIALMSVSDALCGIVALSFTNILLWKNFDSNCSLILATEFLHRIFVGCSFVTIFLIALDRFLHIKYRQRYSVIVPKRKMRFLVGLVLLHNIMISFMSSMPSLGVYMKVSRLLNAIIVAVGVIGVIVLYYKTTRAINQRVSSMDNIFMQSTVIKVKAMVNVGLSISMCTLIFVTPYVIGFIILKMSGNHQPMELAIYIWYAYIGLLANGICSCVIFVLHNKPVKRVIIRTITFKE